MKLLLFPLIISVLFPQHAFAHTLKYDQTIGAVIHVDPNDEPVAGVQSTIYIEFEDKRKQFSLSSCDCTLQISKQKNQTTSTLAAPDGNNNVAYVPYTFPEHGIYQLVLTGEPLLEDSFEPFTFTYTIKVNTPQKSLQQSTHTYVFLSLVILPVILIVMWTKRGKIWRIKEER